MGKSLGTGVGKGHGTNTTQFPLIRQVENNPIVAAKFATANRCESHKMGKVSILLTQDDTNGYILSISKKDRYPSWDEIAHIRYALIPDTITMVMVLPSKQEYINVHNFCFILHEAKHWHS